MPILRFDTDEGQRRIEISHLIIAGWTGRNAQAVQHHIDELAALGVPAPSAVPLYYRAGADLLTQAPDINVLGADSSGEAEPCVLADDAGTLWLGLASDHTDRALESVSVAKSKQVCPKPIAVHLWKFATVAPHLDQLVLHAEIRENEGASWVSYQEACLDQIRALPDLIAGLPEKRLPPGTALLCGTVPAKGDIRPAQKFRMRLIDPVLQRQISHKYAISQLPLIC